VQYDELIRSEEVSGEIFRLMRTGNGFAISYTSELFEGLLPPSRWLFRTEEAAQVGFDFLVVTSRDWRAIERGDPPGQSKAESERLLRLSQEINERLNDHPVAIESSWKDDQVRLGRWGVCLMCDHAMTSHEGGGRCLESDGCECRAFAWFDDFLCFCGHLAGSHAGPSWEPITSRPCLSPGCDCQGFA
jgi:hypothetical protein